MHKIIIAFALTILISACGTNPVTGKSQLTLMSQEQEIALGEQQYPPSQQAQGGTYLIDPKVTQYINKIGQKLASKSAQPSLPYEFVVLNNSVPNAWALPGGKIAINSGLLVLLEDEAQLAAVLGHEIVHAAARHGAEHQATGSLLQGTALLATAFSDNQLYKQAAGALAMGAYARYGRDNELEADKYGMEIMAAAGYDVKGAVELQQTFVKLSKQSGQQSNFFSNFFASHPPSEERVEKNQNRVKRYPKGVRNTKAYLNATRQLRKDQPAYERHQEAIVAANKKEWNKALDLTNKAIALQSREARFYITKGRLLDQLKQDKSASPVLSAFTTAIQLEPSFFAGYFYRGLLQNKLNNYAKAEADLLASYERLQTQPGAFYLGEIAQRNNQRDKAIRYYQAAAQGGGDIGKEAQGRLQQLGIK